MVAKAPRRAKAGPGPEALTWSADVGQLFQNLHRSLRPDQVLKAQCEGCDRRVTFDRPEAVRLFGSDATPMEIRARLVCRVCGGSARIWI